MDKIKILIAEDISATVNLYDKALNSNVYDKQIACNGQKALDLYTEWQPDIILLDMQMPLVSGYSVLRIIREEYKDKKTTIIIATSQRSRDDIVSSAKYGIQGYIVKPFIYKKVESKILEYFTKHIPVAAKRINSLKTDSLSQL